MLRTGNQIFAYRTAAQLSFASMHITSHSALDYLPPTVYATFRIGMAVPLLFLSAGVQVRAYTAASKCTKTAQCLA